MIPIEILEQLFHRPVTNISFTATYPVDIYTHVITPTQIAILAIDINNIYTELKKLPILFATDSSGVEFPYVLTPVIGHPYMFYTMAQWISNCPLTWKTIIGFAQAIESIDHPTLLLKYSLSVLFQSPAHLSMLTELAKRENIVCLDDIDCRTLGQSLSEHQIISNLEQRFQCPWYTPMERFSSMDADVAIPPSHETLNVLDCLVYNPRHSISEYGNPSKHCLDAIVISTCYKEIVSGILCQFLQRLLESLSPPQRYAQTLYIVYNREVEIDRSLGEQIERCRQVFRVVHLLNLEIPSVYDVYYRDISGVSTIPIYGHASGPNYAFFKTMRTLTAHNTVLQLEADCILQKGWLDACIRYVDSAGQFLIAGALNDGDVVVHSTELNHLNGVAFYKTGSPLFQELLSIVEHYMIRTVRFTKNYYSAYDYKIRQFIDECMQIYSYLPDTYRFYRYLHRMLVHTSLIVNALDKVPTDRLTEHYMQLYGAVIVHRK